MLEGHLFFLTSTGRITSFDDQAKSNPPYAIQYLAPSGPEYDINAILFEEPFDIQQYSTWSLQCTFVIILLWKGKAFTNPLQFLNGFCDTLYPYLVRIRFSESQIIPKMQLGSVRDCQSHLVVKSLCVPCHADADATRPDSILALLRMLVENLPVELESVEVALGRSNERRMRLREEGESDCEGDWEVLATVEFYGGYLQNWGNRVL